MIKGRSVPQLGQFEQYAVNALGTKDVQWLPLYDSALYAAAGQQQLTFFQVQQGQGATSQPGAAGTKGVGDTNMTLSGQVAFPQRFMCVGIELQFWSGLAPGQGAVLPATAGNIFNDVNAFARGGALTFTIGQKTYAQDAPLGSFAQQTYVDGVAAVADATTAAASLFSQINTARIAGAVYQIPPVVIPNGQNFSLLLQWQAAIALPSTNATSRVFAKLLGWQARAVQ
jgi:hypothetical protein